MLETLAKATATPTETRLGRSIGPRVRLHPGQSGIVELRDGRDAFAARVLAMLPVGRMDHGPRGHWDGLARQWAAWLEAEAGS